MACERFEKTLIEEAIAPGGDAELAAHLRICPDCREELARQRELQERIMGGVAAMVAERPSPGLLARVRQQIADERAPRAFPWMRWAIGFAVTACAVLVIWVAGRPRGPVPLRQPQVQTVQAPSSMPPSTQQSSQQAANQFHSSVAPAVRRPRGTVLHHAVVRKPVTVIAQVDVAAKNPVPGPEVIVPPGQREAVLRLVNALQSGRVDAASLLRPAPAGDFALLKIAPIEVKPLNSEEENEDPVKQGNH